ncbi:MULTISPECIES: molybdopterin-dependent oxidoreductase [unclassified Nonomuraea]|uniref:molybdopterin-dependent oxidoreductase n=1 Tax=unclassified Nonomuraea TaxID=2593643 RepID=UPI00207BAFF0|nr:molybdopterin-dependent oxidoreductase [Nonomuraea sp. KC401]
MQSKSVVPAWARALPGLVAGCAALGTAQFVSAFVGPETFPVLAVGDATVDLTPAPVKDFAIRTFGESDKAVLVGGVLVVVLFGIAPLIGMLALRRLTHGFAGLAAFGVVGLLAVLTRPEAGLLDALPTLAGVGVGAWVLAWLVRRATGDGDPAHGIEARPPLHAAEAGAPTSSSTSGARSGEEGASVSSAGSGAASGGGGGVVERPAVMWVAGEPRVFGRRRLLTGAAGGVAAAGAVYLLGQTLGGRQSVGVARAGVALPKPATPAKPIPAGADLRIGGLSPFVTPNKDFYRVDTALIVPQVNPDDWTLRIHGMVDRPVEITYADLLRMPLTEADVTLTCVSNEVGGPLAGNARWLGVRMAEVLRQAGLQSGADMLLSTSADGFTCGTPVDVVMDGRDALFAVAMNGEVLPVDHGFPVRQVVPGLYGYVSATKWVVDIKATRFDRDQAYWTPRGWSAKGPIKTQSRIDVPKAADTLKPGRNTVAGVAWAQHKGVDAVEVRFDGGEWTQAKLAEVPGPDTWRQWSIDWDARPGEHRIEVRATDASGYTQTDRLAPSAPDGATGRHTITVNVV